MKLTLLNPKYLGFDIDQTLMWGQCIDSIMKHISSKIGVLWQLKCILPADTLIMLYSAIVLPHFEYACSEYDSYTKTDTTWLQSLPSRTAEILWDKTLITVGGCLQIHKQSNLTHMMLNTRTRHVYIAWCVFGRHI